MELNGIKPISAMPPEDVDPIGQSGYLWQTNEYFQYQRKSWSLYRIPQYWSPDRDMALRYQYQNNGIVSTIVSNVVNIITAVPVNVLPIDAEDEYSQEVAIAETMLLRNAWWQVSQQFMTDYLTLDNGAFVEILQGDTTTADPLSPLEPTTLANGLVVGAVGLKHLDSLRCQRTGDEEYPVIYHHTDGKKYKIHFTRVGFLSDSPSPDVELLGVGLSPLSRFIEKAMGAFGSLAWDKERKGAGALPNQIIMGLNIPREQLEAAFNLARMRAEDRGNEQYMEIPILVSENAPPGSRVNDILKSIELSNVPPDFDILKDLETTFRLAATAIGIDPGELWRGTTVGETKAEADVQQSKGDTKFKAKTFGVLEHLFNYHFVTQLSEVSFDWINDTQDAKAAEISKLEQEGYTMALNNGTLTKPIIWRLMLENGRINEFEYDDLMMAYEEEQAEPDPVEVVPMVDEEPETIDEAVKRLTAKKKELSDEFNFEMSRLIEQAVNGEITEDEFELAMLNLSEEYATDAFYEGMGIDEGDPLTDEEQEQFDLKLAAMLAAILGLSADIYSGMYEDNLSSALSRVDKWTVTIQSIRNLGNLFERGADEVLFEWQYDPVNDHCRDCIELDGQVRTRAEWRQFAIETGKYPQSYDLECRGFFCRCALVEVE